LSFWLIFWKSSFLSSSILDVLLFLNFPFCCLDIPGIWNLGSQDVTFLCLNTQNVIIFRWSPIHSVPSCVLVCLLTRQAFIG
jgi:hypothetical protein